MSGSRKLNSIIFYKYKVRGETQFRHSGLLTEEEIKNIKNTNLSLKDKKITSECIEYSIVNLTDEQLEEIQKSTDIDPFDKFCPFNPTYASSRKIAFLMGLHPKAGKDSPIFLALKQNEIAEQKLVTPILSFLFQPSEKEKSSTQQKSDQENNRNFKFKL